jgi:hypothetical protein
LARLLAAVTHGLFGLILIAADATTRIVSRVRHAMRDTVQCPLSA